MEIKKSDQKKFVDQLFVKKIIGRYFNAKEEQR
jgi:hypothetical protein